MEEKRSGTCKVLLSEDECKSGPYPDSSLKWRFTYRWNNFPTGCFVQYGMVFFNPLDSGIDCSERIKTYCLCRKQGDTLFFISEARRYLENRLFEPEIILKLFLFLYNLGFSWDF